MQILKKYGVEAPVNIFDTMIAHYLINPEMSHKLDVLSENYLDHKCIPIEDIIGKKGTSQKIMTEIDPNEVYRYACEDADITFTLKSILEKELEDNKLSKLFYDVELPLMFVLCSMESNGVNIDIDFLAQMSKNLSKLLLGMSDK